MALDEAGEVGRGQIKQDFGLCWVPLNQAMSKDLKCKSFIGGIIFREQESEIGREEKQYGRVSERWATGLNPGVGGRGADPLKTAEHTSDFHQLRARRVGVFIHQLLFTGWDLLLGH